MSLGALGRAVSRKKGLGKGGSAVASSDDTRLNDALARLEREFAPAAALHKALPLALLNTPLAQWGVGAPLSLVALAAHGAAIRVDDTDISGVRSSSRMFAMIHAKLDAATLAGDPPLTAAQYATIAASGGLGAGHALNAVDRQRLFACLPPDHVEWLVFAAILPTILATAAVAVSAIDTPGCQRCTAAVTDEQAPRPVPRRGGGAAADACAPFPSPGATRIGADVRKLAGVPGAWPRVGRYLKRRVGHRFPVMRCLQHSRATRALAATMHRMTNTSDCGVSLRMKALIGMVFGGVNGNARMRDEWREIAMAHGLARPVFDAVDAFVQESALKGCGLDEARSCLDDERFSFTQQTVLLVAKDLSRTPVRRVSEAVCCAARQHLNGALVGEIAAFVAVLAAFHRLHLFYLGDGEGGSAGAPSSGGMTRDSIYGGMAT